MKNNEKEIEIKRKCPECDIDLFYKTAGNLNWAAKHNRRCKSCSFKGKVGKYDRTDEIKTNIKNKY
jgi:hypothetical protein